MRRLKYEIERLRRLGPRERAREVLHIQTVSWETHGELRQRIEALEQAAPPHSALSPVPPQPPPPGPALSDELLAHEGWAARAAASSLRISVVLATRNRGELLSRAIASVRDQSHQEWELLVVDDASTDGTAELLASIDDPRIRVLSGPGRTVGAARNVALDAASGGAIAYLDDDNVLFEHWLAAVAWAFESHPEHDVLYGACVRDFGGRVPQLQLLDWDRRALCRGNLADMGVLAHRPSPARFDEELTSFVDWDLLITLTRDRDPLRLPVRAMAYTTSAPDRVSDASEASDFRRVQARARALQPLRVLGYNWMFPLVTENYISDELRSLVPHGAELAWYREETPTSPSTVHEPVYDDVDRAVAEFRPDVIILHWGGYAERQFPTLERLGIPFGVRLHGFDLDREMVARLQAHPLCIGVWTYPSAGFDQIGDHSLSTTFDASALPSPAARRDLVLSASAGLPKKDFPLLVEAFANVRGAERRIVMGTTKGFNQLPGEVTTLVEAYSDPPLIQVNLDRDQVHQLQARAAVLVYTLRPEVQFGMPMSIVEGLCSGCAIVVPDRPDCVAYAGQDARTYRNAADVVRHCHDVLAGGPAIEAERERNAAYGRTRFGDPEIGRRFFEELSRGLGRG